MRGMSGWNCRATACRWIRWHESWFACPQESIDTPGPDFLLNGQWQVRVDALVSDFEQAEFAASLWVRRSRCGRMAGWAMQ